MIAGLFSIVVALINKHNKEERKAFRAEQANEVIRQKQYNINFRRARVQEEQLNYSEALRLYLQSADDYGEEDNCDRADALHNAGLICQRLMQYEKAVECYNEAIAIYLIDPDANLATLSWIYSNLANIYTNQGFYDKALLLYNMELASNEKMLGNDNPGLAKIYNYLGVVHSYLGEYEKALEWHFKAQEIRERVLGYDHPDTAVTYNNIATIYSMQEKHNPAFQLYLKAYIIFLEKFDAEHPQAKLCLHNLRIAYETSDHPPPFSAPFADWLDVKLAHRSIRRPPP